MNKEFEYFLIALLLITFILGAVVLPLKRTRVKNRGTSLILTGTLFLIFLFSLKILTSNRYDLEYLISLLLLKNVSSNHNTYYFRFCVSISYLAILFGFFQLLFADKSRDKDIPKKLKADSVTDDLKRKVYINARSQSVPLQYLMIITLILIGPLGLIYALINIVTNSNYALTHAMILLIILSCIVCIIGGIIFLILYKYWVFKIVTTDTVIIYFGLLKRIKARWSEVLSLNVISTGILFGGKMVKVKTMNGNFYFPITIKEKGSEFPKLDLLGEQWITSEGEKKPIIENNCSLYNEIRGRIATR